MPTANIPLHLWPSSWILARNRVKWATQDSIYLVSGLKPPLLYGLYPFRPVSSVPLHKFHAVFDSAPFQSTQGMVGDSIFLVTPSFYVSLRHKSWFVKPIPVTKPWSSCLNVPQESSGADTLSTTTITKQISSLVYFRCYLIYPSSNCIRMGYIDPSNTELKESEPLSI